MNEEIARLLKQNASNVANSGTGSRLDIGDNKAVARAWSLIQKKIKAIDSDFYEIIKER
jgi:hypothetical protein|tara:strand:- start:731 stop:907 length:177 start_codon:yes stop_codon:yes gene_type:complete